MSTKTVGELIDEIYFTRTTRLSLEKEITAMKQKEAQLSKFVGEELMEMGSQAMRGTIANFSYKVSVLPGIDDWPKVYNFIRDEDAFGLLSRAISRPVWQEYQEGGLLVPGTYAVEKLKYSITKAGK
jgi:hypothetical protein